MDQGLTRRELMAGAIAAFHLPGLAAFPQTGLIKPKTFIKSVRVQTAADLKQMEDFYRKNLGFATESITSTELSLIAGESRLRFSKVEVEGEGPLTHFAFNIPQNMIRSALDWTKSRLEVIVPGPQDCDADYPKEIFHFHHWNAHSVFFWDPGFNLVELISRHDLDNSASGAFSPKHIHCISEIAFGARDGAAHGHVKRELGLPDYPRGAPPGSLGDQNGLLLFFNVGRLWGATSKTPKRLQTHWTEVELVGKTTKAVQVPGYPFTVRTTP